MCFLINRYTRKTVLWDCIQFQHQKCYSPILNVPIFVSNEFHFPPSVFVYLLIVLVPCSMLCLLCLWIACACTAVQIGVWKLFSTIEVFEYIFVRLRLNQITSYCFPPYQLYITIQLVWLLLIRINSRSAYFHDKNQNIHLIKTLTVLLMLDLFYFIIAQSRCTL